MLQDFVSAKEKKGKEERQNTEVQIQLALKSNSMKEMIASGNKIEVKMAKKAKLESDEAEVAQLAKEAQRQKMIIIEI